MKYEKNKIGFCQKFWAELMLHKLNFAVFRVLGKINVIFNLLKFWAKLMFCH